MTPPGSEREPWLPDLCRLPRLLVMLSMAELIVLVMALAPDGARWDWEHFISISGFALWLALTVSVLLCVTRRWLARWSPGRGGALAIAGAAGIAGCAAAIMHLMDSSLSYGLMSPDVSLWRFAGGVAAITVLVSGVALRYLYVNDSWKAQVRASSRAEADALQARIKPHFLFNSMNTIAALTRTSPARAEEAVEDLADLFRATLRDAQEPIRLKEELEVARIYQRIEQLRLGERLQVEWDVATLPMRARVPSLIVQPLLENAIYHGIEPLPGGGTVVVAGCLRDGRIQLSVSNPVPADSGQSEREGNRLALANIRERLQLSYGARARLDVERGAGEYRVTLEFPHVEDTG